MIFFSLWGVIFPKNLKVMAQVSPLLLANEKQQPPRDQLPPVSPEEPPSVPLETEEIESNEDVLESSVCPALTVSEDPIFVRTIEVIDSTIFEADQLEILMKEVLENYENREISVASLQKVAERLTNLYVRQGYINSRAVVCQPTQDNLVQIQAIEGTLEDITIEGNDRLANYVAARMWLVNSKPLNARNIEEQLRLLRTSPLINEVTASLRPTGEIGKSLLIVTVEAAQALTFEVSTDNFSPPIIGSDRIGGKLEYRNLLGLGDTITGTYNHTTTGDSDTFDLKYNIPLNAMEGTLELRTFISRSEFDQPVTVPIVSNEELRLESFEVELNSDYEIYSINYRQPIIRSLREELAISGGFTYRDGSPIEALQASGLPFILAEFFDEVGLDAGLQAIGVLDPDLNQDRTSVFNLGVDYVSRDTQGVWALSSQFNVGTGIFDASIRPSPFADSRFFSWLLQVQRLQQIGTDNLLVMVGNLQLSPDSLLSSQQFVIGGGQSVRGFRQNVRFGDNGFRFSIEDRITVARNGEGNSVFQVAPFLDLGQVWNNPDNQDLLRNKTFLGGLGLGLIYTPIRNLSIRVDFALPLVDLEDRGENVQEEAIYFDVKYRL